MNLANDAKTVFTLINRMDKMSLYNEIDPARLPEHVAIIMDGNGRWAKARGLQRHEGHVEGVTSVRKITEAASQTGIKYLTLYTFSTENWNRPKEEVDALMNLVVIAIERETADLIKNNVRLNMIGDFSRMPAFAYDRLNKCIADTSHCTGLTLILAISYSSRWEITEATRKIAEKVEQGELKLQEITPETISENLATAAYPDPDLLIRTGGDFRISNFLLWQLAYAEIYVTPVFWPDFSKEDFYRAIIQYQSRERRFGLTGEQVQENK